MCASEVAFYEGPLTGFNLLKQLASYKRDYLLPRPRCDYASFEKKMSYGDAMVATGALLLGALPRVGQQPAYSLERKKKRGKKGISCALKSYEVNV